MSFDVEQHVVYQIANAPVLRHPCPHFYVEQVFPEDFYRELRLRLPQLEQYKRIDETGSVRKGMYKERFVCATSELEEREFERQSGSFWAELNSWLLADGFAQLLIDKFRADIDRRFSPGAEIQFDTDCRLVRDHTNYAIPPHTDSPRKLVSLLFYLPEDDRMAHLGTSFYAPRDPALRCDGSAHHAAEKFKKVVTMPYRPNSLFGFFKTDRAFHGVDRIGDADVVRDLMLYNVYVGNVVAKAPPADAKRSVARFWQREKV